MKGRRKRPEGRAACLLPVGAKAQACWGPGDSVAHPSAVRLGGGQRGRRDASPSAPRLSWLWPLPAVQALAARRGSAQADRGQPWCAGEMPVVWTECVCILGPQSDGNQLPKWREKSLS